MARRAENAVVEGIYEERERRWMKHGRLFSPLSASCSFPQRHCRPAFRLTRFEAINLACKCMHQNVLINCKTQPEHAASIQPPATLLLPRRRRKTHWGKQMGHSSFPNPISPPLPVSTPSSLFCRSLWADSVEIDLSLHEGDGCNKCPLA